MKLTTNQIIILFQALTELRGAPTVVPNQRGGRDVVYEPYDMGPKFKWNAAKNRSILRRHVDANDEAVMDFRLGLQKLRRELSATTDNPKENQIKLNEETQRVNDEITKLAKTEIDVEGLLLLPASGINIKTSKIPPTVIEELMPLIDGVPEFDEEPSKK